MYCHQECGTRLLEKRKKNYLALYRAADNYRVRIEHVQSKYRVSIE